MISENLRRVTQYPANDRPTPSYYLSFNHINVKSQVQKFAVRIILKPYESLTQALEELWVLKDSQKGVI